MADTREESTKSVADGFRDIIRTLWTNNGNDARGLTDEEEQELEERWAIIDDWLDFIGRLAVLFLILLPFVCEVTYPVKEEPGRCFYAIYTTSILAACVSPTPKSRCFQQFFNILLEHKRPPIALMVLLTEIFAVAVSAFWLASFRYARTKYDLHQYVGPEYGCRINNFILLFFSFQAFRFSHQAVMVVWIISETLRQGCYWFSCTRFGNFLLRILAEFLKRITAEILDYYFGSRIMNLFVTKTSDEETEPH